MADAADSKVVQNLRLEPDEHVLVALQPSGWPVVPFYVFSLGLYEFWRRARAYALTDRRVLIRRGRLAKSEQNLPLVYVQDARVTHSLGIGGVDISTAGGAPTARLKMDNLKTSEARRLADAILAQAQVARRRPEQRPGPAGDHPPREEDTYDQLRKLGELHDSGVLSDQEFEAKKSALLERIEQPSAPSEGEGPPAT